MYNVSIKNEDKQIVLKAQHGQCLLTLLQQNNLFIEASCGGKGFCGKCKVRILNNAQNINPIDAAERDRLSLLEQKKGIRLACRVRIYGDISIQISTKDQKKANIMTSGLMVNTHQDNFNSNVIKRNILLDVASLDDQRDDVQRLEDNIGVKFDNMPRSVLTDLPDIIRNSNYNVTVTYTDDCLLDIEQGDVQNHNYGIALDVGTTTLAAYLMDLNTGEQLDVYSSLNPQAVYGSDVLSRCDFCVQNAQGLKLLNTVIIDEINNIIDYFINNNNIKKTNIYQLTVVGNTIMLHLLLGLSVKNIAVSPFIPVITKLYKIKARQLNIDINANADVCFLPCISGYVGADTVAAILASEMYKKQDISLLIDIGTNGEIALGNSQNMICCSAAAGPAFEGAHIENGVGGIEGAISKIRLNSDCEYKTIGDKDAIGICGSGIVDGIAEMLNKKIIDNMGKIRSKDEINDKLADRVMLIQGRPAFFIEKTKSNDIIALYQKDIREIQLAKSAIQAGINILIKEMGIKTNDIKNVYLAGGFGNYIDLNSAVRIGLIPKILKDRIHPIGNAAGSGAKLALLSKDYLKIAQKLRQKIRYIELSSRTDFQDMFIECMTF